jgi:sec-independent protein translocase protein TatB
LPSVFGIGMGELLLIAVVAMMVMGPKELPKILRKLGQWAGQLRRYALDMRAQSGIDDALRSEGLDRDIAEIRKLARGELGGVVAATREATHEVRRLDAPPAYTPPPAPQDDPLAVVIDREREFPREGADARHALPDTAIVYAEAYPPSRWAEDPVYTCGLALPARVAEPEPIPYAAPEPEHDHDHEHVTPTGTA